MGSLYGGRIGGNNNGRANNAQNGEDNFVKSESWINVGFRDVNPETGEEIFIGLPKGIPLDSVQHRSTDVGSALGRTIRHRSNGLLDMIRDLVEDMDWGESQILTLEVEVRKVNKPEETEENGEQELFALPKTLVAKPKVKKNKKES